jgi:hypothetical protein
MVVEEDFLLVMRLLSVRTIAPLLRACFRTSVSGFHNIKKKQRSSSYR